VALKKAERSILTVLAQHGHPDGYGEGIDQKRLALLAGYTVGGGGYNNALGALRTAGRIERGNPIRITQEGLSALGAFEPLPRGRELMEHHSRHLGKAHREILDVLYEAYPKGLTKEEIAERTATGYAPNGGGFSNALGRLRALHLIHTVDGRTMLAEEMIEEY
jgi:hypothetical protein